jgi:hypothetical protein
MLYKDKYLKYKEKCISLKNQFGGNITLLKSQHFEDGSISIVFSDNYLPGDIRSTQTDTHIIATVEWNPNYPDFNTRDINWLLRSDQYDQVLSNYMNIEGDNQLGTGGFSGII